MIRDLKDNSLQADESKPIAKVAEKPEVYNIKSAKDLAKVIGKLEKKMFEHAKNLEFEEAAELRNEIEAIKSSQFVGPDT